MAIGYSGSGGGITYPLKKLGSYGNFINNVGGKFSLRYVDQPFQGSTSGYIITTRYN